MTTINRSSGNVLGLPGADLEGQINAALTEVGEVATQMAKDVVDSIKDNNRILKQLRELGAAIRDKAYSTVESILNANPEIKSALEKALNGAIPKEETVEVSPLSSFPFGDLFNIGGSKKTMTLVKELSDEDWEKLAKGVDDLKDNFQAFGAEKQIQLSEVASRVTQSIQARSQVSARFDALSNNLIGNLRG